MASRRSSTCYYPRHLNHRSGVLADMRRVASHRQCENDLRGRRRCCTRERELFLVVDAPVNLRLGLDCGTYCNCHHNSRTTLGTYDTIPY